MTATAHDLAGNTTTQTRAYSVAAWSNHGFYQPVDMGVLNLVKGGSTVPLKFEVFAGTELTSTSAVSSFKVGTVSCGGLDRNTHRRHRAVLDWWHHAALRHHGRAVHPELAAPRVQASATRWS